MHALDPHPRVLDALEAAGLTAVLWRHEELGATVASPSDFARLSGIDLDRVTKTVLFQERGGDRRPLLATAQIRSRFDLKALAATAVYGSLTVASPAALERLLDYPPQGVSPLGAQHGIPVIIDGGVLAHGTVTIGGGRVGVELEMGPEQVVTCAGARTAHIVVAGA